MNISDFIVFISILIAIWLGILPTARYISLKFCFSKKAWYFIILFFSFVLIVLIYSERLHYLFPEYYDYFYFSTTKLPYSGKPWAFWLSIIIVSIVFYKIYFGKFANNKKNEVITYFEDLLSSDNGFLELFQRLKEQNISYKTKAEPLHSDVLDLLLKNEKFINFICKHKAIEFIDFYVIDNNDYNYHKRLFLLGLLSNEVFYNEINETNNEFKKEPLLNKLINKDKFRVSNIFYFGEKCLQDINKINNFNMSITQEQLLHEPIYLITKLLYLQSFANIENEIEQTDCIQYYKEIINSVLKLNIEFTNSNYGFKYLNILIIDYCKLLKLMKKISNKQIIKDYIGEAVGFKQLVNLIALSELPSKIKNNFLLDLIRAILINDKDNSKEFHAVFIEEFSSNAPNITIKYFLKERKGDFSRTWNCCDAVEKYYGLLEKYYELNNVDYESLFNKINTVDQRQNELPLVRIPNLLKREIFNKMNDGAIKLHDYLFYSPGVEFTMKNLYDFGWSFVEIYSIVLNVEDKDKSYKLKHVINYEKFQRNPLLNSNTEIIPPFYDFNDYLVFFQTLSEGDNKDVINLIGYKNEMLSATVISEDGFFAFYLKINLPSKDYIKSVLDSKVLMYPTYNKLIRVEVKFVNTILLLRVYLNETNDFFQYFEIPQSDYNLYNLNIVVDTILYNVR